MLIMGFSTIIFKSLRFSSKAFFVHINRILRGYASKFASPVCFVRVRFYLSYGEVESQLFGIRVR